MRTLRPWLLLILGLPWATAAPAEEPKPTERAALLALPGSGFEVPDPAARSRLALELVDHLADPDPALRDGVAFTGLSTWLRAGLLDQATRQTLAERLLPRVEAEEDAAGFARSFAALALSEVARADRLDPRLSSEQRQRLITAAETFLLTTRDYRGFDDAAGWRHAVAHGADLALQLGLHRATTADETRRLLAAVASQVAPAAHAYVHTEPDRLARAVFFLHARGQLDAAFWDGWFAALASPAPLGSWAAAFESTAGLARRHNLVAFLHALGFAARANPGAPSDAIAGWSQRELERVERGGQ